MASSKDDNPTAGSSSPSPTLKSPSEREVMDPVTHLPLLVHNSTSAEIRDFSKQDTTTADASPNVVAAEMNALISEEIHHNYWRYPEFEHQYRKRTALVVAVAAGAGGAAALIMTSVFRRLVGSNEVLVLAMGGLGCGALALVAGAAILQRKIEPPNQNLNDDTGQVYPTLLYQTCI